MRGCAILIAIAGCYTAPRGEPCSITCTDECPGDLTCTNGFCVAAGDSCAHAFAQVSVGDGFACALDDRGGLWCWGDNENHQIDPGAQPTFPFATPVGTTTWTTISAGRAHVCGITGGHLMCWGANARTQITSAIAGDVMQPIEITANGGPATWTSVVAGNDSTCAIGEGKLYCWGANEAGQLGIGGTSDVGAPTPVSSALTDWTAVSIARAAPGYAHACAISEGIGLLCWGYGADGELGTGAGASSTTPVAVTLGATPVSVATTAYATLAALPTGELYAWGYASDGVLGDPAVVMPSGNANSPVLASNDVGWTSLTGSGELVCGLLRGDVWCWGTSHSGDGLGDGVWRQGQPGFAKIATGATSVALAPTGRSENGCYVADGAVRCWGDNRYGQLGQGTATMATAPVEIGGAMRWTQLAAGVHHACGITDAGSIACWGATLDGAVDGTVIGNADVPCTTSSCDAGEPRVVRDATAVGVGEDHTCALHGGQVTCWGLNSHDQLGTGAFGPGPNDVAGTFTQLFDVHGRASCALDNGEAQCWGMSIETYGVPMRFPALDTMRTITFSGFTYPGYVGVGCFLDTTNTLSCFGDNSLGQYGNGPRPLLPTCNDGSCDANECDVCPADCGGACPVQCGNGMCDFGETATTCPTDCGDASTGISRLSRTYLALGVGWDLDNDGTLSCGVTTDAGVECWGRNRFDVLATGTATVTLPEKIAGLEGCTDVAVGEAHVCAHCGGQILCFGDNRSGAVGIGGLPTDTPVMPPQFIQFVLEPDDHYVQLVAGVGYTCARTAHGHGYCWGASEHGALGIGGTASPLPLVVRTQ